MEVPTIISSLLVTADCGAERGRSSSAWWCARSSMFSPGQASTTSSFSLERISERNVEQIVEAFKIFFQDKVHPLLLTIQLVLMLLWMRLVMGFFALFPRGKKCQDRSALGVGTECGLHLIHAVRL